jgi:hypothetical protein
MCKQQFSIAFLEFLVFRQQSPHHNKFVQFEKKDSADAKRRFEEPCSKYASTSVAITHDALDMYHSFYENRCAQ